MLDPRAHRQFGPIAALGLLGQRLAALALAVDVAIQLQGTQPSFHLLGPIGGISLNSRAGIAPASADGPPLGYSARRHR